MIRCYSSPEKINLIKSQQHTERKQHQTGSNFLVQHQIQVKCIVLLRQNIEPKCTSAIEKKKKQQNLNALQTIFISLIIQIACQYPQYHNHLGVHKGNKL